MIRAVIFDMDGLMFDTERMWGTFWEPTLKQFGLKPTNEFINAMRGTTGPVAYEVMHRYFGEDLDGEAVEKVYYAIADKRFAKGVPDKPGLRELMDYLDRCGIPMAVASSSPEHMVLRNLKNAGIDGRFCAILCGDRVERSKPDPDIFLKTAAALGQKPADTLVLEDSHNGVRAGHAGGFRTVMVPDLLPVTEEMERLADRICASLDEVHQLLEEGKL